MSISRNIKLYGLFNFLNCLDFYIPLKIVYFYHLTGSYATAASIISLTWIFSAIMEIPTGIFSDFVGRKRTMIMGAFSVTMAYILYAIGSDFWILVFGAFLEGSSRSFFSGNNDAFLHNSLSEQGVEGEYQNYYGKINSLLSVSAFIAAFLSGFIASISYSLMMWLSVIPQFASLILILFMKDTKFKRSESSNIYAHLKEAIIEVKSNLKLRYLSLASIFGGSGMAAYEFQIAVVNAVWPTWAIGIFRAAQEIGVIPSYYYANKMITKFGQRNIVLFSSFITWLGNIVASILQSTISPLVIASSLIFYGSSDTANQSLLQKEFTERQRATIASLNSLGSSIVFSIVAYIAGLVANQYNPFWALITTQIFFIPVLYFKWKLLKQP